MWEMRMQPLFSMTLFQKVLLFITTTVVVSFAWLIGSPQTAFAADAAWQGDTLMYEQSEYRAIDRAKSGDSHGIAEGSQLYRYVDGTTASIIYFGPDDNPITATSARFVTYTFSEPNNYSDPKNEKSISVSAETENASECNPDGVKNISYIICPVAGYLAGAMDWLFDVLASFLKVQPLQTSENASLFKAWAVMRNIANLAFVIAFLVIIYSQLTSAGLSNYGIKQMLPRLIVASILVNVSYWICAIAIDMSNILGYSLQSLFMSLRDTISEGEIEALTWGSLTTLILSGGAIGAAAVAKLVAIGSVSGAIYMLLPILAGVVLAALIALLIMAIRQALIIVFVIISPLAFVAYILPNTESLFEKWRSVFTTLLVLFPIFSVLFGGSQLAGMVIMQAANGSIVILLLGMATQIAPLVILPFLFKFGGAFLNKFGAIANDSSKGLKDRAKNFATGRAEQRKASILGGPQAGFRRPLAKAVQSSADRKRKRENALKNFGIQEEARYTQTKRGIKDAVAKRQAQAQLDTQEAITQSAVEKLTTTNGHHMQTIDVNLRLAKKELENIQTTANAQWEQLQANESSTNVIPTHLADQARQARTAAIGSAVVANQVNMAKSQQQSDYASALRADEALRQEAGGIAEHGADSALAAAVTAERAEYGKKVEEARSIIKHFNLSSEQRQAHAMGQDVTVTDSYGNTRTFTSNDLYTHEAAISEQLTKGTVGQAIEIIGQSGAGGKLEAFKTSISEEVAKSSLGAKTGFLGGATINEIAKGTIGSPERLLGIVQENIAKGKFSADTLVSIDKDAIAHILKAAQTVDVSHMDPTLVGKLQPEIQKLKNAADVALTDPRLTSRVVSNVEPYLDQIRNI